MEEEEKVVKEVIPIIDEMSERGLSHCSLSRFWFHSADIRLVANSLEELGYTCLINDEEPANGGLEIFW